MRRPKRGRDRLARQRSSSLRRAGLIAALTAGSTCVTLAAEIDDDAARRQFLTSCGTCHTAEPGAPHRQGPRFAGILGRKAGTVDDFKYSSALASSAVVWNEATLDRRIEDDQRMVRGTVMAYHQRDPEKRRAIIEYLKTLGP